MRLSIVAPSAVACALGLMALAAPASAQTYGQPYYQPPATTYGQPQYYGGSYGAYGGVSEADPRAYGATGGYGGGYSGGYGYEAGYGAGYGYGGYAYGGARTSYGGYQGPYGYGRERYDRGGRYGYSYPRYDSGRRQGYRDWYGYNDDRPPSGGYGYSRRYDDRYSRRDCDCSDVYLYDR